MGNALRHLNLVITVRNVEQPQAETQDVATLQEPVIVEMRPAINELFDRIDFLNFPFNRGEIQMLYRNHPFYRQQWERQRRELAFLHNIGRPQYRASERQQNWLEDIRRRLDDQNHANLFGDDPIA